MDSFGPTWKIAAFIYPIFCFIGGVLLGVQFDMNPEEFWGVYSCTLAAPTLIFVGHGKALEEIERVHKKLGGDFQDHTPKALKRQVGSPRHALDAFREHADAVTTALVSTELAQQRRQKANITLDPDRRQSLLDTAAGYEQLAFDDCRALHDLRAGMRERGLTPPHLPTVLGFVDQEEIADAGAEA